MTALEMSLFEHPGDMSGTKIVVRTQDTLLAHLERYTDLHARRYAAEAAGRMGYAAFLDQRITFVQERIAELRENKARPAPRKEGWSGYPGLFQAMTDAQYQRVLEEARLHLGPELSGDEEPWRVWNRLNARFDGGVERFVAGTWHTWK